MGVRHEQVAASEPPATPGDPQFTANGELRRAPVREHLRGMVRTMRDIVASLPLVGLELRVSSRRPTTFAFRMLYVFAMMVYTTAVFASYFQDINIQGAEVSKMSEVGKRITSLVLAFQLIGGQLAAIIAMAGAFSEELRYGRLAALLSAPVDFGHIVVGKYVSRIAHVVVLILAGLPALAIVRVFGGVPWGGIVLGVLLTLCACLAAGALAMHCSLREQRPYGGLFVAAALLLIPTWFLVHELTDMQAFGDRVWTLIFLVASGGLLVLAVKLLAGCVAGFRAKAMAMMGYDPDAAKRQRWRDRAYLPQAPGEPGTRISAMIEDLPEYGVFARIPGSPIIWRELLRVGGISLRSLLAIFALILIYLYAFAGQVGGFREFSVFVLCLMTGGVLLGTAVFTSASIASERAKKCWTILLTTPLNDEEILQAKAWIVIRRMLAGWILLGAHLVVMTIGLGLNPAGVLLMVLCIGSAAALAMGLGFHFSLRSVRVHRALLATCLPLATVWLALPYMASMFAGLAHRLVGQGIATFLCERAMNLCPIFQLDTLVACSEPGGTGPWALSWSNLASYMPWMLIVIGLQGGLGLLLAIMAMRDFRKFA